MVGAYPAVSAHTELVRQLYGVSRRWGRPETLTRFARGSAEYGTRIRKDSAVQPSGLTLRSDRLPACLERRRTEQCVYGYTLRPQ